MKKRSGDSDGLGYQGDPSDASQSDLPGLAELELIGQSSLSRQAAGSVAWLTLSSLAGQAIQFLSSVVVARLLFPSEFGLVALMTTVTGFASVFTDAGVGSAVIQAKSLNERFLATAFWVSATASVTLAGLVCLLAKPIAEFYGAPQVAGLMLLASIPFLISLSVVNMALLERALRFRLVAVIQIGSALAGSGVTVGFAAAGAGASSLVLGVIAATVVSNVGFAIASPWRPRHLMDRASLRRIWRFSSGILGFGAVNYWARNLDNVLVGRYVGIDALAYYNRAYTLMLFPVQLITSVVSRVMLPTLARLRDDTGRMRDAYQRSLVLTFGVTAPIAIGIAVSAPALIVVVFGSRWLESADLLSILSISGVAQVIAGTTGALYQAFGATGQLFRRGVLNTAGYVVAFAVGVHWGASGIATGFSVASFLLLVPTVRAAWKHLDLAPAGVARHLFPTIVATAMLALAALCVRWILHDASASVVLSVQVSAGLVTYVVATCIFATEFRSDVATLLRQAVRRTQHAI